MRTGRSLRAVYVKKTGLVLVRIAARDKKAVRNRASDPKKKTECSQGKDNTLKGVAERLKSVKPHGTKKAIRDTVAEGNTSKGRSGACP